MCDKGLQVQPYSYNPMLEFWAQVKLNKNDGNLTSNYNISECKSCFTNWFFRFGLSLNPLLRQTILIRIKSY